MGKPREIPRCASGCNYFWFCNDAEDSRPSWVRPSTKAALYAAARVVKNTGVVLTIDTPCGPVRVEDEVERLAAAIPGRLYERPEPS